MKFEDWLNSKWAKDAPIGSYSIAAKDGARAAKEFYEPVLRELYEALKHTYEKHNHITRDIKPWGECPSCNKYHALNKAKEVLGG